MSGHLAGSLLDRTARMGPAAPMGGIDMHAGPQELRAASGTSQEHEMDPIDHREVIVHRLLERGIGTNTLAALLPDWRDLILEIAGDVGSD